MIAVPSLATDLASVIHLDAFVIVDVFGSADRARQAQHGRSNTET
jgi:hypothetical protein